MSTHSHGLLCECFLSPITAFCIGGGTKRRPREKNNVNKSKIHYGNDSNERQAKISHTCFLRVWNHLKDLSLKFTKKKKNKPKNSKGRLSAQPYKKISTWHKENNWQLSSVLTCPWSYPMVSCLFEYKGQKRPHECPQNRTLLALTCPAKKHYVFIRRSLELLTPTTRMPLCLNAVLINDCIF